MAKFNYRKPLQNLSKLSVYPHHSLPSGHHQLASIADIAASILGLFYGGHLPSYWVRLRALGTIGSSNLPLYGYWPTQWQDFTALPQGLITTLLAFAVFPQRTLPPT